MISLSDYPVKVYFAETEDGYILTLLRCNKKFQPEENVKQHPVVLIQSGFAASGPDWFNNVSDKTLPYMLALENYDCWIMSQRGTILTGPKPHVKYTIKQREYWNFGLDEVCKYDMVSVIDFILSTTGEKALFYIGHSMGAGNIFMTLASRPEYNKKVKMVVGLAPAVYGQNSTLLPLIKLTAPIYTLMGKCKRLYCRPIFGKTFEQIGNSFIPPCLRERLSGTMMRFYAKCIRLVWSDQINLDQCVQAQRISPGRSSWKSAIHAIQISLSNKLQQYDYGRKGNLKRYGHEHPPLYDLSKVTSQVALFSSKYDYVIHPTDVRRLKDELGNVILYKNITETRIYHEDFKIGKDADELFFKVIIDLFNQQLGRRT